MNRTWESDFAQNHDWNQCRRASRNAETAVYWAAVVTIFFAVILGWVTP